MCMEYKKIAGGNFGLEILKPEQYEEYENFVSRHSKGGFTQSALWRKVKNNWGFEAVVSRNQEGGIVGAVGVLIQTVPVIGTTFLYAPRGPVCDLHDEGVLLDLKAGVDEIAERYNAHEFRMDPEVLISDKRFLSIAEKMGFEHNYGPDGFEGIQARFNYRLYLNGRDEEELFANLTQGARRKIRIAMRSGVQVRPVGQEFLDDFVRIMQVTGERDGFNTRPKEYFVRMLDALKGYTRLYMGFYQGVPVCGAVTVNYAGKCCYVYGASDNIHREVMPNYLMQWEMIRWAVETGCQVYDFQGISGDFQEGGHMYGLYQFKRGFNGQVDELAGEFNYVYQPFKRKLVDQAVNLKGKIPHKKRKTSRKGEESNENTPS